MSRQRRAVPEVNREAPVRRRSRVSGRIVVERIEAVPMTPEQHQAAVRALAELLVEWQARRSNNPPT